MLQEVAKEMTTKLKEIGPSPLSKARTKVV